MTTQNEVVSAVREEPRRTNGRPDGRTQPRRPSPATSGLADGQMVVVAARWILVGAGLFLVLWNPEPLGELRFQVGVLLLLAVVNFFLQAQLLMKRPSLEPVMIGASAFDLLVITLLIVTQGGFQSNIYIFYFPALLAISVAFNPFVAILFTGGVIFLYSLIALVGGVTAVGDAQLFIMRVLMFTAVAFCGALYWQIELNRQQAARRAQQELLAELRQYP
ncbi:MAG: hypothetical protein KJ069_05815 [Anaerolineae bacterium]|nr:hypothetical protein [Anaerolineae bacterium]